MHIVVIMAVHEKVIWNSPSSGETNCKIWNRLLASQADNMEYSPDIDE